VHIGVEHSSHRCCTLFSPPWALGRLFPHILHIYQLYAHRKTQELARLEGPKDRPTDGSREPAGEGRLGAAVDNVSQLSESGFSA